ncbi:MAG: hypothetical protein WA151_08295 [Desulfatirhabdiaceae bacterium]
MLGNHFHLSLRIGIVSVSTLMRRLLTGYAVSHNRRHNRSVHLLQNRYKSIVCQENVPSVTLTFEELETTEIREHTVIGKNLLNEFLKAFRG